MHFVASSSYRKGPPRFDPVEIAFDDETVGVEGIVPVFPLGYFHIPERGLAQEDNFFVLYRFSGV